MFRIAGADSVSCSMGAIVYHVLSNPRVHSRLMTELESAVGEEGVVTYEKVKSLPYFQACIDEG